MTDYNDYMLRVTPEIDYESFGLADVWFRATISGNLRRRMDRTWT